jgi:hypothetical protein
MALVVAKLLVTDKCDRVHGDRVETQCFSPKRFGVLGL